MSYTPEGFAISRKPRARPKNVLHAGGRERPTALKLVLLALLLTAHFPALAQRTQDAVLWRPADVHARDLYWGPGGKQDQPRLPVTFLDEDRQGSSPKFSVRAEDGKKWKAKLGLEAQPETAATRLLWAVGYSANEDYFFPELRVENLPRLHRGANFVSTGGEVSKVRLQRHRGGEKKAGNWSWRHNPLRGTREFNGLRVMMALVSNWDLKDDNNAIYDDPCQPGREFYEVSDLGASFGTTGKSYTDALSKGNLRAYRHARFLAKVTPEYVDFNFPTHPPLLYVFNFPYFWRHLRTRWVGKHIPREDVRWIAGLLAELSPEQIRDAFRAAGYSREQVEAYSSVVEDRIKALQRL